MSFDLRFALTAIVLAGTALFLKSHYRHEVIPLHTPLSSMPIQLGRWRGTDERITSDVLQTLGSGDFLSRTYRNDSASPAYINLFMAYFPSQSTGDTIHSPQNCLPGSGWFPLEVSRIMLTVPGHDPFRVNRYYVAQGEDRAMVLYWYWAHNRGVASEYWAKFYLISDAIRLNRTDGALIRLTEYVRPGETTDSVQQSLLAFSGEFVPFIDTYVPD